MADEPQRTSFWVTLPGIMTGTASLITALVGVLALFMSRGEDSPPPPSSASSSQTQVPADDPAQDAAACQRDADAPVRQPTPIAAA